MSTFASWYGPLLRVVQKEFRQILRDPAMLRIVFVAPLIQLLVLSFAVTTDVRNVRLTVLDEDRTLESRRLIETFFQNDVFVPAAPVSARSELEHQLERGKADAGVCIPSGYARDIAAHRTATIGVVVDGENSSTAGRALGYLEGIIRQEGGRIFEEWRQARPELDRMEHRIEAVTRFFYNPQLESRYYMVPGILVILLTLISGMLTGMAIVREKEIGTLEQLLVTPLTPAQIIIGKVIPFAVLALVELCFAVSIAVFVLGVPFAGSVPLLFLCTLAFILVALAGGVLASTVSQTQQQAMLTVWFFMLFGIMTSGFFYPIENMPRVVYLMTYANPLRYYMAMIRGVFLKGVTLQDVLPNLLPLLAMGVCAFALAALRFRKRMA